MEVEVKTAAPAPASLSRTKTGLRLTEIDPDINKDGKIDKEEAKIFKILSDADHDNSGFLTTNEVYTALASFVKSEKTSSKRKSMLIGAVIVCLVMLAANIGLTACIVFLAKDTQVSKTGKLTGKNGVTLSTSAAKTTAKLFEYPSKTDAELSGMFQSPVVLPINSDGDSISFTVVGYDRVKKGQMLLMRTADNRQVQLSKKGVAVRDASGKLLYAKVEGKAPTSNVTAGRRLQTLAGEILDFGVDGFLTPIVVPQIVGAIETLVDPEAIVGNVTFQEKLDDLTVFVPEETLLGEVLEEEEEVLG